MAYLIKGKVIDQLTGSGIANLRIEAWDMDPGVDDYLGSAISQEDGSFEISFNEYLFREFFFFDRDPDLYFKVFYGAVLLLSTESTVIWNLKSKVKDVTLTVPSTPEQPPCVIRHVYLKIEKIENYSPVRPEDKVTPPIQYGRDCMRNEGHHDGTIPEAEIQARSLTAVVYREYLDSGYLIPKPDKLILADINEPAYNHRVPGTVIYTRPCERLKIHVWNCDDVTHSFHTHGLRYGIDSDGSWPFGTQNHHGHRSDAICPDQTWTYTYDVTDKMIGVWPFHDHTHHMDMRIDQGLFGGIVVLPSNERPPRCFPFPFKHVLNIYTELAKREKVKLADFKPPHDDHNHHGDGHEHGTEPEPGHGHGHGHGHEHGHTHPAPVHEGHTHPEKVLPLEEPYHLPAKLHIKKLKPESRRHLFDEINFLEELAVKELGKHVFCLNPTDHVPVFFHLMTSLDNNPVFDSGDLEELTGVFEHVFAAAGDNEYFCMHHPIMTGVVHVAAGGPANVTVNIVDAPAMGFAPADITVGVGGTVRWENHSMFHHTVTSRAGASLSTHCINGRGFVGNSPTIVGKAGQRLRFYVFNLDTSTNWHNFHPHSLRWKFGGETIDIRSMGPAESFIVDAEFPPVLLLDEHIEHIQHPDHRPPEAKVYNLKGDFVFHCHVHHHMMSGMVGLIRSKQRVWLTDDMKEMIIHEIGLALDDGTNSCPVVDEHPCHAHGIGHWEEITGDPQVTFMHSVLLPGTEKVLYWGYTDNPAMGGQSRLWDYFTPAGIYSSPTNQPATLPGMDYNNSDMWSAEHALLNTAEGHVLIHGGFSPRTSFVFNPSTLNWSQVASTAQDRFYSSTLLIGDNRALTLFGSASKSIEAYTHGVGWAAPITMPPFMNHHQYYPWTYLLPDSKLFIAGPHVPTHRFDWNAAAAAESFATIHGNRSSGGEKGTSVLQILRPGDYKPIVIIAAGNLPGTENTAEQIDLSAGAPIWTALPNMNQSRSQQCTATLLPDGRIFIAGGLSGGPDGGPCEIFDPLNPGLGWQAGPNMKYVRVYHSSFILLRDGSVLAGGDPMGGDGKPTPHERFFPDYFNVPRPVITAAPVTINYAGTFIITTPQAADISEVILMRPGAVTHGFNMSQRGIECVIAATGAGDITVETPPSANHQPPGWHLLFILDSNRVPSEGRWIRLT